jgi:hypothetical protein
MAPGGFCTAPSRPGTDHVGMDIVSVALGVLMFGVLLGLIYGIDRI